MDDAKGEGAMKLLSTWKLDMLDAPINSHCGVINSAAHIQNYKLQLKLSANVAQMTSLSQAEKDKKSQQKKVQAKEKE